MADNTTKEKKSKKTEKTGKSGFNYHWNNLKAEFKKIIWPSREALTKKTAAVVASTVVLSVIISVVDLLVKFGLGFILS
ncbi:MAG: preprotein translocase subunit SecE [Lachnospiraceae bacterium]|nr:preprotein translocase subunit SecE [Lachnospiraceae bacterium]